MLVKAKRVGWIKKKDLPAFLDKSMASVGKEDRLRRLVKMDAIVAQGPWLPFPVPGGGGPVGGGPWAGFYLMADEIVRARRQRREAEKEKKEKKRSLLDGLILRLEQEHLMNLVLFLTSI